MYSNKPLVNNIHLAGLFNKSQPFCFSEDRTILVVGSWGGSISLISTTNGRLIKLIDPAHQSNVTHLAISSDRNTFYSTSEYEIKIWDVNTFKCLKIINLKTTTIIMFIGYINNDMCAVNFNYEGSDFNIINLEKEGVQQFRDRKNSFKEAIVLSKDSKHIVSIEKFKDKYHYFNKLVVWSVNPKEIVDVIEYKNTNTLEITHPYMDKGIITFATVKHEGFEGDYDIYFYNIFNKESKKLGVKWSDISSIDVSFDNKYLLLTQDDGHNSTHLIDVEESEIVGSFFPDASSRGRLNNAKFLPNSYDFAVQGFNFIKCISFSKVKNNQCKKFEEYFKDWSCSLPKNDSRYLNAEELFLDLSSNTTYISCAAISYNRKLIAVCYGNKIRLFKVKSGVLLKTITVPSSLKRKWVEIESIKFSPDDKYIMVNMRRYDPYSSECYENIVYKLKNFKVKHSKNKVFRIEKNHSSGNISIQLVNSMLVVSKNNVEKYTIYNFLDEESVSMKPNGKFVATDRAINKYIFCMGPNLIPEELSSEEINHFRKKGL